MDLRINVSKPKMVLLYDLVHPLNIGISPVIRRLNHLLFILIWLSLEQPRHFHSHKVCFNVMSAPYFHHLTVDFTSHRATYPSALNSDHISDIQLMSKTGRIKSAFQNESVALNCDVDLNLSGPIVQASAVLGYNGWLAGYQSKFDSQRSKITQNNVALGYSTGDFILHTNVNDGQEFGGSIYQRVSPKLETGIQLAWTAGSNDTRFGIGAKYDLDKDAAVRAKVNNVSQIGLGYQQKLREGITLTLSALIDGKNFNQGGHKIGVALELEA
uniref:Voltage-dependent anion-selective channel n=1 Tax=Timema tahoe TaxID=61484 RepID=A0A7R9ILD5_9NEOP|nr:unnamed protein product [Timema tahoe]